MIRSQPWDRHLACQTAHPRLRYRDGVSAVLDPGVSSTVFTPTVGAFESIDSFVSDVVPDDPAANIDLVTVGAEFRTLSQIAVINVAIPEPNTLFISLVAMTVIANRRRKA